MTRLVHTLTVDAAGLADLRSTRDDIVAERALDGDRFTLDEGPFEHYERTLEVEPGANGDFEVTERFHYRLAIPFWWIIFALPVRRALRNPPARGSHPWWAPPALLDARSATVIGLVATLAIIDGYLGTVITQTITFAADEFDRSDQAQGIVLAAVHVGVLPAMLLLGFADRSGRRTPLLASIAGAIVFTALGAFSPELWFLGSSQAIARGFSTAGGILILVVAMEELPAGARAYGTSILLMAAGLGSGMAVWVLPIADVNEQGWRVVYVVPVLALPVLITVARRLPESKRFTPPAGVANTIDRRRMKLLAATSFLTLFFAAPASQLQNDFLKDEQAFSALKITIFTVATSTPAGLIIFFAGRMADIRGRRSIAAAGIAGSSLLTVAAYSSSGSSLWLIWFAAIVLSTMAAPAIGVYGPELFATSSRSTANGLITVSGVLGSASGLIFVSTMKDQLSSYGQAFAIAAIGPLIVAVLVIVLFPETRGRELEELNPVDETHPLTSGNLE